MHQKTPFCEHELDLMFQKIEFRTHDNGGGMELTVFSEQPPSDNVWLNNLMGLVKSVRGIQEIAIAQYTPVVEDIVNTRSHDVHHIQRTLDHLLDFACHPTGLQLYKTLCRYHYTLDPAATVGFINAYREMWDSETLEVKA